MNMDIVKADSFETTGINLKSSQEIVRPGMTFWQDAVRRFKKNKVALACLVYLIIIISGSIIIPFFSKYSISEQDLEHTYAGFNQFGHIFGTDDLGRDLLVRVWTGGRISLFIGIVAALLDFIIGVIYGGISGYFGGRLDNFMMRIVDILIGIPYIMVVILLTVVLKPGVFTIIIALAITGWTRMARLVRGQVMQLKEQEFVLAAKVLGGNSARIIYKHLLPNVMGVIIVSLTLTIPGAIFTEAFLSYIGLGVRLPIPSWGSLASDGIASFQIYPWLLFIPAIFISLTILSFNILGDALRDALDPKLRK